MSSSELVCGLDWASGARNRPHIVSFSPMPPLSAPPPSGLHHFPAPHDTSWGPELQDQGPCHLHMWVQYTIWPMGLQGSNNCCYCSPTVKFSEPWGHLWARQHGLVGQGLSSPGLVHSNCLVKRSDFTG